MRYFAGNFVKKYHSVWFNKSIYPTLLTICWKIYLSFKGQKEYNDVCLMKMVFQNLKYNYRNWNSIITKI